MRFPRNLDEARSIADLLNEYKSNHFFYVLVLFCSAYIYKQLFCVPGSVFLNLVGGALFGVPIGVPLCCLLNATGASCCYLLVAACRDSVVRIAYVRKRLASLVTELNSQLGERAFELEEQHETTSADHSTTAASQSPVNADSSVVQNADAHLPSTGLRERVRPTSESERISQSSTDSSEQKTSTQGASGSTRSLLFVLIGLRLLPLCPQCLINLASPSIGVPLRVFFLSALIGLLPCNFICVQTGSVLRELRSLDSLFNFTDAGATASGCRCVPLRSVRLPQIACPFH